MYSNTILKLDLIVIIIQKYCNKYLKPDKNIDEIKKSKTIQFVLDQLNDIRKTKDFKVLKSIFTIEKKYKIKDLKDWLNILCANNFKLFSKHFKLDVEINITKGYRTYVNLLSKLGNNKTKVDLKEPNKKISILFNLLFYDGIVGGMVFRKKTKSNIKNDKSFTTFFALQKEKNLEKQQNKRQQKSLEKIKNKYFESTSTGKLRWQRAVREKIINSRRVEEYGTEIARDIGMFNSVINALFDDNVNWENIVELTKLLNTPDPRLYNEIYPIVQQSDIGSCWINAILVALMYPYDLKTEFANIITLLLKKGNRELKQVRSRAKIREASFARIIQEKLRELLVLQYDRNSTMTEKECIKPDLSFVKDFISLLTKILPNIFTTFSQYDKYKEKKPLEEIILEEGGTFLDIFNLIKILLEKGFKFRQVTESDFIKQVGDKIITICVAPKQKYSHYQDQGYIPDGFQFASIILVNTEKSEFVGGFSGSSGFSGHSEDAEIAEMLENSMEEEESVGHVITILTDQNQDLFFYNGWMNDKCVTPLQPTDGENIPLKTEDGKELVFDLTRSFGIIISFKVEPIPI
tara:strand:+ start:11816 stop:13546 length:1731 start_codon:yes stop_codon:yes gene_type:complete